MPAGGVKGPAPSRAACARVLLPPEGLRMLLRQVRQGYPEDLRAACLLVVLHGVEPRPSEQAYAKHRNVVSWSRPSLAEAAALNVEDLDLESRVPSVRVHGQRARTLPFYAESVPHVRRWLTTRAELGLADRRPLFCPMRPSAVHERLERDRLRASVWAVERRAGLRHWRVELTRQRDERNRRQRERREAGQGRLFG